MTTTIFSPTDCYFCRSGQGVQKFRFPCECMIYAHPDCYAKYIFTSWDITLTRATVQCVKCKQISSIKDAVVLQINIPPEKDDDLRPLTKRDLRREQCIVALVMSIQGTLVVSLVGVVLWMYVKLIMGVFP